jgi:hypothetical protein
LHELIRASEVSPQRISLRTPMHNGPPVPSLRSRIRCCPTPLQDPQELPQAGHTRVPLRAL